MCKRMEDDDHEASRFKTNITNTKVTFTLILGLTYHQHEDLHFCRFITDPIHGEIEVPAVCQGEHHFYCQHHKQQHYHFHVLDMILDIVY